MAQAAPRDQWVAVAKLWQNNCVRLGLIGGSFPADSSRQLGSTLLITLPPSTNWRERLCTCLELVYHPTPPPVTIPVLSFREDMSVTYWQSQAMRPVAGS